MSDHAAILAMLAGGHIVAVLSPGPNNALVLQMAGHGRRAAFWLAAGIFPAGVIWASLGIGGVGKLLQAAPGFEIGLRIAGGLYLMWLGLRIFRASFAARKAGEAMAATPSALRLFAIGFMTNFTNPKSIAWYTSIFAATGAFALPLHLQAVAVIGMPGIAALWYVAFGSFLTSAPVREGFLRVRHWIDRFAAAVLVAFGLRLLVFS